MARRRLPEIKCSIEFLLAEKRSCTFWCDSDNDCVVISETRRARVHYRWRFINHIIIQKHLPWSASDFGRRSHAHSDRRTSPESASSPAVALFHFIQMHQETICRRTRYQLSRFTLSLSCILYKTPVCWFVRLFVRELSRRSEQETLYARIIHTTGSWRALSFTEPEHVARLNGAKRGRPTVMRDTSRAARRLRSPKTSRASHFRFVNDVNNCCCRYAASI